MRGFRAARAIAPLLLVLLFGGFSDGPTDRPCLTCHEGILQGRVRHRPAAEGECTTCHDPELRTLTLPAGELCLTCHAEVIPPGGRSPHDFFLQGECQVCHARHASDEPSLLIVDPIKVCESCHPDQRGGRSHPVGFGVTDPRTGTTMTCTSTCHDPHSTPRDSLLRRLEGRELCWSCHPDKF